MARLNLGRAIVFFGLGLFAAGCSTDSGNSPFPSFTPLGDAGAVQTTGQSVANTQSSDLKLEAGDKIRVTVYGEDKLSGEYQIDTAGYVSLPLAGTIKAAGLSKPELERVLAKQFSGEYLRRPKVTVDVVSFRPFYVLGEVQKPGEYQFRSGLNVLSAIAIAGGASYRASTSKVLIQRSGSSELVEVPLSASVKVLPGDLIRVPERFF
jgi:protein involved in polysaccharide export with SLBB domain